jgi:hypothetical protein
MAARTKMSCGAIGNGEWEEGRGRGVGVVEGYAYGARGDGGGTPLPLRGRKKNPRYFYGLRCAREDAGCAAPVATFLGPVGAGREWGRVGFTERLAFLAPAGRWDVATGGATRL